MRIVSDEKIGIAPDTVDRLQWLDMSAWDNEPVPEREWAIRDRVPLKQAGLFSGEGGTGKSIIELMKNVAHVTGEGLARLDARAWSGLLSRRRGRQGRNPHPPRRDRQALRRHLQGADRRRPARSSAARQGCDALRRHQEAARSRSPPSIAKSTRPPATSSRRTSPSTHCRAPSPATRSTGCRCTPSQCICRPWRWWPRDRSRS